METQKVSDRKADPVCCEQHSCPTCGGCLFFPCSATANGIHPKEAGESQS